MNSYLTRTTGYYPDDSPLEGGFVDCKGKPLCTLQGFLAGKDPYVSVAMDKNLKIPYGTVLWIPGFDLKYKRPIVFRVVDNGGAFVGKGWSRMDICTASKKDSEDNFLNKRHTIFPLIAKVQGVTPFEDKE